MKINKTENIKINQNIQPEKKIEKKPELKKAEGNGLELNANYNIAFQGLFNKKKAEAIIVPNAVFSDIELKPNTSYNVGRNCKIALGNNVLNLYDSDLTYLTNQMQEKQSIIIGREAYLSYKFDKSASREHIELTKEANGRYSIKDLNTTNGTKIFKNVQEPSNNPNGEILIPNQRYRYPEGASIKLGNNFTTDISSQNAVKNLPVGQRLMIGRGQDANLRVSNEFDDVSRYHLLIEREKEGLVVTDLGSTNGSTLYTKQLPYGICDFTRISEICPISPNKPYVIPNDSQLCLGKGLIIDLRNKNIQNILDEKGKIKIGRNQDSDILVEGFFGTVSNNHLTLEKIGNNIIATDLNSTNGTEIIPKNKAKAFFKGAENIELAQANIGDCYLLSTIYALSRNPYGARLLENMVQIDENGDYHVKFHNQYPITVHADELDGEQIAGREKKRSVSGELAVKAIERAYGRRLNHPKDYGMTMYMNLDKGGFPHETLKDMTGIHCLMQRIGNYNKTAQILSNIYQNGRDNYIVTCCTPSKPKVQGSYFTPNHAYAVGNIDMNRQLIEILNPHDTRLHQYISWREFSDNFEVINYAEIPHQGYMSA